MIDVSQGRCLEFGPDGTPLYVPAFTTDHHESHHLFKRSLIFNTTGRGRVVGSIDQKYLEQIVQDFNKTINGGTEEDNLHQSSLVIFDDPIDIPEPELSEITTRVFQNTSIDATDEADDDLWESVEVSDEFLADIDIIYKDVTSDCNNLLKTSFRTYFLSTLFIIVNLYK